jgi:PAS domain-containing protein
MVIYGINFIKKWNVKCKMNSFDIVELLNLVPLNIYWKNKHGVYIGCNLAQAKNFGFKCPSEIIGKTDDQIAPDIQSAQSWIQNDKKIMQSGHPVIIEEKGIFNNTELVSLSYKAPFRDQFGDVAGIIGISIDITEEKKNKEKLFEEKKNAQIALDNIIARLPGHVYWLDRESRYLGCNDIHAKSSGLKDRCEIIAKTNYEMPWAEHADELNAINNKVMKKNRKSLKKNPVSLLMVKYQPFFQEKSL